MIRLPKEARYLDDTQLIKQGPLWTLFVQILHCIALLRLSSTLITCTACPSTVVFPGKAPPFYSQNFPYASYMCRYLFTELQCIILSGMPNTTTATARVTKWELMSPELEKQAPLSIRSCSCLLIPSSAETLHYPSESEVCLWELVPTKTFT